MKSSHKSYRRTTRPLLTLDNAPTALAEYATNHSESAARAAGFAVHRIKQRNAKLRLRLVLALIEGAVERTDRVPAYALSGHEAT